MILRLWSVKRVSELYGTQKWQNTISQEANGIVFQGHNLILMQFYYVGSFRKERLKHATLSFLPLEYSWSDH